MVNKIMSKVKTFLRLFNRKLKFNRLGDYYLFSSYYGKYCDSPKMISEMIHFINPSKKIVWLLDDIDNPDVPDYVIKVKIKTEMEDYYLATASIIVDNVYGNKEVYLESNSFFEKIKYRFLCWVNTTKGQQIFSTWHGIPLKKMGIDQIGSKIIDFYSPNTTMLLGDIYTKKILNHLTFNKLDFKIFGFPRNEKLLNSNKETIYKKLKISKQKKVVLFAPTFRQYSNGEMDTSNSGINQLSLIDVNLLLEHFEKKFGNDWVFVVRFHYHVEKLIDWKKIKAKYGDKIINGNNSTDMIDYLTIADVLITDVSSCMFDFMVIKKPVFLFFPDYNHYISIERGLYLNIEELPFDFSCNFNDLLKSIDTFNFTNYLKRCKKFSQEIGIADCNESTKKIAKFILSCDKTGK